jgi:hypothetical protein
MGCTNSKPQKSANPINEPKPLPATKDAQVHLDNPKADMHRQLSEDHGMNYNNDGTAAESDAPVFTIENYEGDTKNGMKHGRGKYKYPDGSFYEGEFENNKKHGKGYYKAANGDIYEGEFKDGLR